MVVINSKAATRTQRARSAPPASSCRRLHLPLLPHQHLRAPASSIHSTAVLVRCLAPSRFATPDAPAPDSRATGQPLPGPCCGASPCRKRETSSPAARRTTRHTRYSSSATPPRRRAAASRGPNAGRYAEWVHAQVRVHVDAHAEHAWCGELRGLRGGSRH